MSWPDFMVCIRAYNDRQKDPSALTDDDRAKFHRMFEDDDNN